MNIGYIPSLDGIRGISVLLVFLSHVGLGNIVPGGLGVTIFFFLSGFLITTLMISEFDQSGSISFRKFYLRRLYRLFPPLLCCLAIAYGLAMLGLIAGGYSLKGIAAQVFYLANYQIIFDWVGDRPVGLDILWSLAVEEHFYIFFPFVMLILLKNLNFRQISLALGIVCLAVMLWRCYLVYGLSVPESRTYYATDTRIDSIVFGCILAVFANPLRMPGINTLRWRDYIWIGVGGMLLLVSLIYRDPGFRETTRYSVQGIALMPLFFYAIAAYRSPLFRCLNFHWIKRIGVYSYSIYLIHFVMISLFRSQFGWQEPFVLIVSAGLASLGFAIFVDRYIDRYFRVKRKNLH